MTSHFKVSSSFKNYIPVKDNASVKSSYAGVEALEVAPAQITGKTLPNRLKRKSAFQSSKKYQNAKKRKVVDSSVPSFSELINSLNDKDLVKTEASFKF